MATEQPYGSWTSPISPAVLVAQGVGLSGVRAAGDDVYWLESRPAENRTVLVRRAADGALTDVTPAPFNVRTRVHEYGGGAYVRRRRHGLLLELRRSAAVPRRLPARAPERFAGPRGMRYADVVLDRRRGRLIRCARTTAAPASRSTRSSR